MLDEAKILEMYRDHGLDTEYIETDIIAFARLIEQETREECASMFEGQRTDTCPQTDIAKAIRSIE